ncbi:MAG: 2-oxoacid:acceptor oxidoreductase family protein [Candidatus Aminicenantes bacterium]|nr:2-oxoacid:acceptor oxidoreductase family protein [Candidatus Aminicenantes bacterium]
MNIRFSGFGGQGIILSGYIFGTAAVNDGKSALQTQSYGSESRGGGCRSDVLVSQEEIYDLGPSKFDVLVALSQSAYNSYIGSLGKGGILLVDEDLVDPGSHTPPKTHKIKATDIAFKKFGNKIMANMVMMGFVNSILGVISKESLKKAIRDNVAEETAESNLQAFDEGYRMGKEIN